MKKAVLILILILSVNIYGQKLFDKYEDMDDVTSIIVTDEMFKMIGAINPESQEAKDEISVLTQLTGLKIFTTDKENIFPKMLSDAKNYIKQKNMKELIRINDDDAKVNFYVVKDTKPYIAKELLMFLKGKADNKKMIIMSLEGKIDLRKLSKLNSKIKVINKKYLEEVEKKMVENK